VAGGQLAVDDIEPDALREAEHSGKTRLSMGAFEQAGSVGKTQRALTVRYEIIRVRIALCKIIGSK
jgi:hypothetical protein